MHIQVPEQIAGLPIIVSVSGGKDSTALCLVLRESLIEVHSYVFADTGWEAPETYEYLDYLETILGPIVRVHPKRDMVASIRHRTGFPARMQRWCTRELKIIPLRAYHDTIGDDTVCVVGVRGAESKARSRMAALTDEPPGDRSWGGWIWRPLLDWTVTDVLETHNRHGVRVNPLYRLGHDRVGCYPCIFARKNEIRLIPKERIDTIRSLEDACVQLRRNRNDEEPGRYKWPEDATFFRSKRAGVRSMTIDEVVSWSKTKHGGVEEELFDSPSGGCVRWGICDIPVNEED